MYNNLNLVSRRDPVLHRIAKPVSFGADVAELIQRMFEIIDTPGRRGVGLAAPQLGISKRVIVVNYGGVCTAVINPVITRRPGKIVTSIDEGCLTFPGQRVNVKRNKRVIVTGFDVDWTPFRCDARNFLAFIFQHEIDHLNGITIL